MKLKKLHLNELSAKQKEIYNFHLVAAKLAQYGYHLIKLDYSYWKADYLACSEEHNIKVIQNTDNLTDLLKGKHVKYTNKLINYVIAINL